jgi:hypothetical protein
MAASLLFTSRLSTSALPADWTLRAPAGGSGGSTRPAPVLAEPVPLRVGQGFRVAAPARGVAPESALPTLPLVLVGVLVLLAVLVAPERPRDQAAICQRHAGPVACRVW